MPLDCPSRVATYTGWNRSRVSYQRTPIQTRISIEGTESDFWACTNGEVITAGQRVTRARPGMQIHLSREVLRPRRLALNPRRYDEHWLRPIVGQGLMELTGILPGAVQRLVVCGRNAACVRLAADGHSAAGATVVIRSCQVLDKLVRAQEVI